LRAAYAPRRERPSLPLGRYFRMLLVGYFEGIDSERGLEWRCADSLSLREFLRLGEREPVPGYSWLSRTRGRLPLELHDQVFTWVLQRLAEHGLAKGDRRRCLDDAGQRGAAPHRAAGAARATARC
jgi:transposase